MSSELEQRSFGRTGEKVSVIGLGGAALYKHSYELGVATVKHALDLGVTYFDTSPASGEVQGRRRFSSQFETTVQWKWRWGIHIWSLLVESRTRKNFLTIGRQTFRLASGQPPRANSTHIPVCLGRSP